jgi:PPM family protein phosphatase
VEKEPDLKGMGSTLTAAFVRGEAVFWAHVGDSRLYLFREDELTQITEDDTMAGFLLTEGELTREEARVHPGRNFLFDFIGSGEFEEETGSFTLRKGDLLLLTTDGLHDRVPEEKVVSILRSNSELDKKLDGLVSIALKESGKDNVTVVGVEV